MKSEEQPHAKPAAALTHAHAPLDPLRSTHKARERVPLARHVNGSCRMHGGTSPGAPAGNRRAYKHGLYGQAMREVSAMVRLLGAGLGGG